MDQDKRCSWAGTDVRMLAYHDNEWGEAVDDDHKLFEFLVLEGAQAGLSWRTILDKREGYREAFAGFDPAKVMRFDRRRVRSLLTNPRIVRNRLKVESAVNNAAAFVTVQHEFGSFYRFLSTTLVGSPRVNRWRYPRQVPARTADSDALSKALKQRGFRFVGTTISYAFMQATGLVNDHLTNCFRHPCHRSSGDRR
jgi:DNA-3-methyladenine glycosylase I